MRDKCKHEWWYDVTSPFIDNNRRRIRFCNFCHECQCYSPFITIRIDKKEFSFLHKFRKS